MFKNSLNHILNIYSEHKKAAILFLMAGAGTAVVYLGLFFVLWNLCHVNHFIAVTVGYTFAAIFHFFVNRNITFKYEEPDFFLQITKYLILIIVNYVINLSFVHLTIQLNYSPYIGLLLAAITTAITGYLLFNNWVFKRPNSAES